MKPLLVFHYGFDLAFCEVHIEATHASKVAIAERTSDRCFPDFATIVAPLIHRVWHEGMWPELHARVQTRIEEWLGESVSITWLPTERHAGAWIATDPEGREVRVVAL